ncbi:MAG: chemotaxis protein CheW [Myxococcota bacterium]
MSAAMASAELDERLLTFEIGQALYALPISAVVEVTEVEDGLTAVPTLPARIGGVINFHGDALPVLRSDALLGVAGAESKSPAQVVVVSDGPMAKARLGLPVDEILGLVSGPRAVSRTADPVAERRLIGGRLANILDPARLVATAAAAVDRTRGETD